MMSFSKYLLIIFAILLIFFIAVYFRLSGALYGSPPSDHFDGKRFFGEESDHSFADMVKWLWEMETVDWPEWIDDPPQPKPVEYVNNEELKITYINHATALIQTDSLNILTDPIWSDYAGPFSWAGTPRVRAPGVKFEDLPKIDIILISHDHYDHLDLPTLKKLALKFQPIILAGLGMNGILKSENIENVVELDWWQEYTVDPGDVKFTFVPARHSSGRNPFGNNRTLWGGYVIEGSASRIYYAGDTAYGQFLHSIAERYNSFRLTILPVGSYEARWFMRNQHMNPDDAVLAHQLLNSKQSIGIHFGTFVEHPEQTINAHEQDLATALNKYGIPESDFWILGFGAGRFVR
ncbi:MAG: hypothetical protein GY839_07445 [candidate division Zixibacteria bacterium]|nr:hypothetical protein [candidate division Zixibacteria bacterium]